MIALENELIAAQQQSANHAMLGLRAALQNGNARAAAKFFIPQNETAFRRLFAAEPAKMAPMATAPAKPGAARG